MFFDPIQLLFIAPAVLLAAWAQMRVKSAYAQGMQEPSQYTGADVARAILDQAGLSQIPVEETPGELSDHYDPSSQTVRLSTEVYHSHSLAAVGIAAHEVGHALQHAHNYGMMGIRNLVVPAAIWAPQLSILMIVAGLFLHAVGLIWLGIATFSLAVIFQLVNLPVEFDASNRAKQILPQLGMVDAHGSQVVANVLNAAAWTYVAATLQAVLMLAYYVFRFGGMGRRDND